MLEMDTSWHVFLMIFMKTEKHHIRKLCLKIPFVSYTRNVLRLETTTLENGHQISHRREIIPQDGE